jgi:signal peptidase II
MPASWLAPYVRIINWHNTGSAFGLFQESGGIFAILAIIVSALIIYYFPRIDNGDWPLRLAMSLQLGGAVGNLIDRINLGYVTDYVSVGNFPVFNVADASITGGVIVLLFYTWWGERQTTTNSSILERERAAGS